MRSWASRPGMLRRAPLMGTSCLAGLFGPSKAGRLTYVGQPSRLAPEGPLMRHFVPGRSLRQVRRDALLRRPAVPACSGEPR
jgi:hypothetical protein